MKPDGWSRCYAGERDPHAKGCGPKPTEGAEQNNQGGAEESTAAGCVHGGMEPDREGQAYRSEAQDTREKTRWGGAGSWMPAWEGWRAVEARHWFQ